jgi:hypothetical protein
MPRLEVMLFRKKSERLGIIEAGDEREATTKAAGTLNVPPERHWQAKPASVARGP